MADNRRHPGWLVDSCNQDYVTVAASQTNAALGARGGTGQIGDVLDQILVVPASTSPGAITIADGAGSAITVFAGGASSLATLIPFPIPIGARAIGTGGGGWTITTGASLSVIAIGNFS